MSTDFRPYFRSQSHTLTADKVKLRLNLLKETSYDDCLTNKQLKFAEIDVNILVPE